MNAEITIVDCIGVQPGCTACMAEYQHQLTWGDHDSCDAICEIRQARIQRGEQSHRQMHEPRLCEGCGTILDDRRGTTRITTSYCRMNTCVKSSCAECGHVLGTFGPITCALCGYFGQPSNLARRPKKPRNRRWR